MSARGSRPPAAGAVTAVTVHGPRGVLDLTVPTAIVVGMILALFFGSQLVNALIPARTSTGPGSGPISGPGQPGPEHRVQRHRGGQPGHPGGQTGIERLVTSRFPLSEAATAFQTAADKSTGSVKVHLTMG